VGDTVYRFETPKQRGVIGVLYREWKRAGSRDGCGLTEAQLAEEVSSASGRFRIDSLFRDHPAMGQLLRRSGPGMWALFLEPQKDHGSTT
jgi:hypothetical protein